MVDRNGSYLHIDGTIVCLDDLHCIYITPDKGAIVCRFTDGQQTEIKYAATVDCGKAWAKVEAFLKDDVELDRVFLHPHKTVYIRIVGLRYAEFDLIDNRFILQYKDGATYLYQYPSEYFSHEIYRKLLAELFGKDVTGTPPVAKTRHRADFWAKPMQGIDGLVVGGVAPNEDYWSVIDKAFVDAYPVKTQNFRRVRPEEK